MRAEMNRKASVRCRAAGFTLMELMIVLVIVALLAAIAVPSYSSYVIRSKRTDATAALLKVAAAQEKFFLQNNTYTTALATSPPAGLGITGTDGGYYTLAITAPDAACPITACWVATATPVGTLSQGRDKDCTVFQINSLGQKVAKKGATDNTKNCWIR